MRRRVRKLSRKITGDLSVHERTLTYTHFFDDTPCIRRDGSSQSRNRLDERFPRDLQLSEFIPVSAVPRKCPFYHSAQRGAFRVWYLRSALTQILYPRARSEKYVDIVHALKKQFELIHTFVCLRCWICTDKWASLSACTCVCVCARARVRMTPLIDSHSKKYHHQSRHMLLQRWRSASILYLYVFTEFRTITHDEVYPHPPFISPLFIQTSPIFAPSFIFPHKRRCDGAPQLKSKGIVGL